MNDKTKDYILYGVIIVIFLYILRGKQTAVVTVKINPQLPVDNTGTEFDYSICGISPDVIKNGLPIRFCINPSTGIEHPVSDYPNGNTGQVFLLREQSLVDRSNALNGVANV